MMRTVQRKIFLFLLTDNTSSIRDHAVLIQHTAATAWPLCSKAFEAAADARKSVICYNSITMYEKSYGNLNMKEDANGKNIRHKHNLR